MEDVPEGPSRSGRNGLMLATGVLVLQFLVGGVFSPCRRRQVAAPVRVQSGGAGIWSCAGACAPAGEWRDPRIRTPLRHLAHHGLCRGMGCVVGRKPSGSFHRSLVLGVSTGPGRDRLLLLRRGPSAAGQSHHHQAGRHPDIACTPGAHCRFNLASGGRSHWGRQRRSGGCGVRDRGVGGSIRRCRTAAAAHYFPITAEGRATDPSFRRKPESRRGGGARL